MRAAISDATDVAFEITEHGEVLAEEAHRNDRLLLEVLHRHDGVPVHAEEIPAGGTWPGLGQTLIHFLTDHANSPSSRIPGVRIWAKYSPRDGQSGGAGALRYPGGEASV